MSKIILQPAGSKDAYKHYYRRRGIRWKKKGKACHEDKSDKHKKVKISGAGHFPQLFLFLFSRRSTQTGHLTLPGGTL